MHRIKDSVNTSRAEANRVCRLFARVGISIKLYWCTIRFKDTKVTHEMKSSRDGAIPLRRLLSVSQIT